MILTVVLPKDLHAKVERDKKRTGLSKSDIVRQILREFYERKTAA